MAVHGVAIGTLAVGKFHDVDRLEFSQELVHFFLAVAGSFSYDQIGKIEEGALICEGKTVAGFDKGAEIAGEIPLCILDGFIRGGAQTHHAGPHCHGDLLGEVGAEHTDYWDTVIFQLFYMEKRSFSLVGKFSEDFW